MSCCFGDDYSVLGVSPQHGKHEYYIHAPLKSCVNWNKEIDANTIAAPGTKSTMIGRNADAIVQLADGRGREAVSGAWFQWNTVADPLWSAWALPWHSRRKFDRNRPERAVSNWPNRVARCITEFHRDDEVDQRGSPQEHEIDAFLYMAENFVDFLRMLCNS